MAYSLSNIRQNESERNGMNRFAKEPACHVVAAPKLRIEEPRLPHNFIFVEFRIGPSLLLDVFIPFNICCRAVGKG